MTYMREIAPPSRTRRVECDCPECVAQVKMRRVQIALCAPAAAIGLLLGMLVDAPWFWRF